MHNPVCPPGTQARARQAPLQGADGGTGLRMPLHVRHVHSILSTFKLWSYDQNESLRRILLRSDSIRSKIVRSS